MEHKKWSQLIEQGHRMLEEKKFAESEQAFRAALELEENAAARNHMALAVFLAGEASRSLEVLGPNLVEPSPPEGNPSSLALAAQILAALGRVKEARNRLKDAIGAFERGRACPGEEDRVEHYRNECTTLILQGAAALNEHQLVLDLYRRWERYYTGWESRYLAGVAAFNTGRYGRAASLWGSFSRTVQFAVNLQQMAFLVERALVPPFPLEYKPLKPAGLHPDPGQSDLADEKIMSAYIRNGTTRAAAIAYLFSPEIDKKSGKELLTALIRYGGEWGKTFGKCLLEAAAIPDEFKITAAIALVECGVFSEDEPIAMFIDGCKKEIKVIRKAVSLESDPELDRLNQWARNLRDQGCLRDALELLEPLYEQGRFHPPSMLTLANLYRVTDRFEKAIMILELLNDLLPENPAVLFNLAGLSIECGMPEQALNYLEQLDLIELDEKMTDSVENLRMLTEMNAAPEMWEPDVFQDLLPSHEKQERSAVEKKMLPLKPSLLRGLRNMPNEWLLNICSIYGLEPVRLRPDREKLIAAALNSQKVLWRAVAELDKPCRDLLADLLKRGGWARLNVVTRKFGTMEKDGYYWHEQEPQSPLGRLWSRALVMVGRARLTNGYVRIAAIPAELQEQLASILNITPDTEK